ncbi:MAG TPA: neprosin family prolyl endopeptidase [Terracidiphilus sp.]|jgi:hypothetical protein
MTSKRMLSLALFALGALVASAALSAQTAPARMIPFSEFQTGLSTAKHTEYVGKPQVRVKQAADFEEMRQHLTKLYTGVKVTHSFVLETDTYDCIPINQQPSVRLLGITKIAEAPPAGVVRNIRPEAELAPKAEPAREAVQVAHSASQARQVAEDIREDKFGHSTHCEANTIPIRRVTLEEMTRFSTLREFFNKGPNEAAGIPKANAKTPPCTGNCPVEHKYSVVNQTVNNWGGNSTLNVWSPYVNTSQGEIFSLTQHWYVGGSGTSLPGLQTVEVGWQNYPAKYGDERSRLFIYHTADGYHSTGCYNHDCGDFVQTNGGVYLGGGFTNYSTTNGTQWEFNIQVQLYQGNWWIFYGTTPFGYYPGSLFHGGQLTHNATNAQYGTETVGSTVWPPAGSGGQPSTGWGKAAYQRDLFYITSSHTGIWESLSNWNIAPCYAISGPFSGSGAWALYFYDGGPGGGGC